MTTRDPKYFQPFNFTHAQIKRFWENAIKDLKIARKDPFPEVSFTYAYQALLKTGITLLAKVGRSRCAVSPDIMSRCFGP